ncbi:Nudix hydrolase family protein [Planococcus antarcticus DSM 14505]|uniref:Nudix hydrolase family protein n=1 Tax=Planococcus antarcticus DSM 14505 TaxID=1185653 RepID=A0AA87LT36_9BACL|nr:NUDIX hydrolase [Planococcus antarcticus]EIM06824.1 Nudix hydrolase family protein [Planococcus antarcticus DSM 14505]
MPSGEIEKGETTEQACVREGWEETGFKVKVKQAIYTKTLVNGNYDVTTYYFLCEITEGQISYEDPDEEIEEIAWKTSEDLLTMQHDYPEDQEMLLSFLDRDVSEVGSIQK